MAPRRNKNTERKIAEERIERLFEAAHAVYEKDPSLSGRYVILAIKIAMKYRVKIPDRYRHSYCRKCFSFFSPGNNTRTRINSGKVTLTCTNCGYIRRYPIKERR
ncbi:ribonuclease P protein component 4 [Methanolacinia paynteri]|uniref:ribonuclease P protein component 4 n=1 Tax=Methanolacinia paynteri TaxID=230356 RepID=UPI00064E3FE2|nr:ribonuclease P protein component 4 [Methanolacinia paynteri]